MKYISAWGQDAWTTTMPYEAELWTHTKIYKLLFCKEEGGNMKGFKKGIALIAVLAFLITAILPVSGFAGGNDEGQLTGAVEIEPEAEVAANAAVASLEAADNGVTGAMKADGQITVTADGGNSAKALPATSFAAAYTPGTATTKAKIDVTWAAATTIPADVEGGKYTFSVPGDDDEPVAVGVLTVTVKGAEEPATLDWVTAPVNAVLAASGPQETQTISVAWSTDDAPADVTGYTWTSSTPATATVEVVGSGTSATSATLTPVAAGTTTIKVQPTTDEDTREAKYAAVEKEITISAAGTTFTVTLPADQEGGKVTSTDTLTSLAGDAEVTLTIEPSEGYKLTALSATGDATLDPAFDAADPKTSYTLTLSNADSEVSATFEKITYTVTVDIGITGGTVTADKTAAAEGDTVTLTVNPTAPNVLKTLTVTPESGTAQEIAPVVGQTEYTFEMPAADVTVTATFGEESGAYTITVADDVENGAVGVSATKADKDAEITVTTTPDPGYELDKITVTDASGNDVTVTDGKFIMPEANVTVSATFKALKFDVSVSEDITNGTVEADVEEAATGQTVTITATPDNGYILTDLAAGDAQITPEISADGGSYTFIMPGKDVEITATFTKAEDAPATLVREDPEDASVSIIQGNTLKLTAAYTPGKGANATAETLTAADVAWKIDDGTSEPSTLETSTSAPLTVTIPDSQEAGEYTVTCTVTAPEAAKAPTVLSVSWAVKISDDLKGAVEDADAPEVDTGDSGITVDPAEEPVIGTASGVEDTPSDASGMTTVTATVTGENGDQKDVVVQLPENSPVKIDQANPPVVVASEYPPVNVQEGSDSPLTMTLPDEVAALAASGDYKVYWTVQLDVSNRDSGVATTEDLQAGGTTSPALPQVVGMYTVNALLVGEDDTVGVWVPTLWPVVSDSNVVAQPGDTQSDDANGNARLITAGKTYDVPAGPSGTTVSVTGAWAAGVNPFEQNDVQHTYGVVYAWTAVLRYTSGTETVLEPSAAPGVTARISPVASTNTALPTLWNWDQTNKILYTSGPGANTVQVSGLMNGQTVQIVGIPYAPAGGTSVPSGSSSLVQDSALAADNARPLVPSSWIDSATGPIAPSIGTSPARPYGALDSHLVAEYRAQEPAFVGGGALTNITTGLPSAATSPFGYGWSVDKLYGEVGHRLNNNVTINWWNGVLPTPAGGRTEYRFVPVPDYPSTGLQGPALVTTPNQINPNQLTLTTTQPLEGNENTPYAYVLMAVSYNANGQSVATSPSGEPMGLVYLGTGNPVLATQSGALTAAAAAATGSNNPYIILHPYLIRPQIPNLDTFVSEGIRAWNGGTVYAREGQTRNLPILQANATMEGGSGAGWGDTKWIAIPASNTSGDANYDPIGGSPANFAKYQAQYGLLENGGSQSGDLTSLYQLQPSDVAKGWMLQTDPNTHLLPDGIAISNPVLKFYAMVQYGSNPDCTAVAGPFTLNVVQTGALVPLNGQGQPVIGTLTANGLTYTPPYIPPQTYSPYLTNTGRNAAELFTLSKSQNPVALTTMWIPNQQPSGVDHYAWKYTNGPGAVTISGSGIQPAQVAGQDGAGIRSQGQSWRTNSGTLTVNAANFSEDGQYTFTCQAEDSQGNSIAQVATLIVNAGRIAVGTGQQQADSFRYWVQPAGGYFKDTAAGTAANLNPAASNNDVPTGTLSSYGAVLAIGTVRNGLKVDGITPAGETIPVAVNGRFQLWFDPSGIQYGLEDDGVTPRYLSADPNSNNYWAKWVELEWRYKPSQYAEDDGNGITIPTGLGFSGVNSPLLTSGPLTSAMDGWQFSLEIHDRNNENLYTATRWVLLDLNDISPATLPVAQITSYPASGGSTVNLTLGSSVTFMASAQDSIPVSDLTYQWQSRPAITASNPNPQWANITGATEAEYSLENLAQAQNGLSFRCILTNTAYAGGIVATSEALTLNLSASNGSVVVTAPTQATLLNYYASRTLTTSVEAGTDNGSPVTYQWYQKSWTNHVPTGAAAVTTIEQAAALIATSGSRAIAGATSDTLATAPLAEGVYEFTCHVANANDPTKVVNSAPVYVVVTERSRIPAIATPASNPDGQVTSIGVVNGQAAVFSCDAYVASLEPLTYQWETASSVRGPWREQTCTDKTLTIANATTQITGQYFRCKVTNAAANETTTSNPYLLNVWNVANTPVITSAPHGTEITWNDGIPNGEISLSCTARVSQGADHNNMTPMWTLPNGQGTCAAGQNTTPVAAAGNVVEVSNVNNGDGTWTSVLSIPVTTVEEARAYSGNYTCTWFNNQRRNEDSTTTTEANAVTPALTDMLLAPQVTSGEAAVTVLTAGTPQIKVQSETPVTKAVGETASFSVTALLNEAVNTNPPGSLVYVWQMTSDGGETWNNCLSSDGSGQFTDTFTTIPLTQTMYDNSTASNVPGSGIGGVVGNANTVYMYRVIVANRTTGAKATSQTFKLIITATASEPPVVEEPTLESAGNITIEGTTPNRYATGITVSATGTTVDEFLEGYGWQAPAGYTLQIVGSNGTKLDGNDRVYTGCVLQLVKDETGDVVDSATIIVRGDVLGANNTGTVGTLAINQLVRMAQDLNETRPLDGIYEMAGDFNGNGSIDIADLVAEAQLLSLHEPVQK